MNKKRGKSIKININFSNRWLYTLILIGILIAVGVGIYAYGTTSPSSFGHSMGELAPPAGCSSGQFLKLSGSSWTCSNVAIPTYSVHACSNPVGASDNVLDLPTTSVKLKEIRVHGNGTANFSWELMSDQYYMDIVLYKNDVLLGPRYRYCVNTVSCDYPAFTTRIMGRNVWYADSQTLNVNEGDRITIYGSRIGPATGINRLRNFRVGYCLSAIPAEVVFDSTPIDWEE